MKYAVLLIPLYAVLQMWLISFYMSLLSAPNDIALITGVLLITINIYALYLIIKLISKKLKK